VTSRARRRQVAGAPPATQGLDQHDRRGLSPAVVEATVRAIDLQQQAVELEDGTWLIDAGRREGTRPSRRLAVLIPQGHRR